MSFKVGQTVVHLTHGVGELVAIEERTLSNKVQKFYILNIEDNGAPKKVFVPLENAETRMRKVISKTEASDVVEYIAFGKPDAGFDHQTWNRRYREYMDMIHTGDTMSIAKVYVALKALGTEKDLSFGERKLADQCYQLLVKELQAAGLKLESE